MSRGTALQFPRNKKKTMRHDRRGWAGQHPNMWLLKINKKMWELMKKKWDCDLTGRHVGWCKIWKGTVQLWAAQVSNLINNTILPCSLLTHCLSVSLPAALAHRQVFRVWQGLSHQALRRRCGVSIAQFYLFTKSFPWWFRLFSAFAPFYIFMFCWQFLGRAGVGPRWTGTCTLTNSILIPHLESFDWLCVCDS